MFAGQKLSEKQEGGALYRCKECALGFRYPTPSSESLEALYRASNVTHWQYDASRRIDWQITRDWLDREDSSRLLLDVGCFDGAFADYLGPAWTAHGIEINEEAARKARERNVTIVGNNASELASIDHLYDAVVAFDVIEHIQDPAALLAGMSSVTKPGGVIVIASGNFEAWSWKMMGSAYWYCTIPEHLAFISKTWCERIAPSLGLHLAHTSLYCHEQRKTFKLTIHELATNTLYRLSPGFFAALRRSGWGDKNPALHKELAYYPPTWTTAKDHIIAIFRKA